MRRRGIEGFLWEVGADLGSMADELGGGRPRLARARMWEPRVDLVEDDRRFVVKAEIAGCRSEDIQVLYVPERHALLLRGVRLENDLGDATRTTAHHLEVLYGEFSREIPLPAVAIEAHAIRAQYRNGFLVVAVPKMERTTTVRTVVTTLS